ncbi:MAG TPA: hypothetical protein VLX92_14080, partial [Kofleriaceae bacterium]|nr:hypothetical protein [Kofleriaceae bacterium]
DVTAATLVGRGLELPLVGHASAASVTIALHGGADSPVDGLSVAIEPIAHDPARWPEGVLYGALAVAALLVAIYAALRLRRA